MDREYFVFCKKSNGMAYDIFNIKKIIFYNTWHNHFSFSITNYNLHRYVYKLLDTFFDITITCLNSKPINTCD